MVALPLDDYQRSGRKRYALYGAIALVAVLITFFSTNLFSYSRIYFTPIPKESSLCPLYDPIAPKSFYKDNSTVLNILHDKKYRKESIKRLSGAVQVDTLIFDNPPNVPDDPKYWKKFAKFHDYLEKTFPLVYKNLEITKINTYGLVYSWKGTDKKLKPILLTGHQDTVPVQKDSLDQWTYPPFEGHYDGEFIYGRGASDCKNVVIAILETLELLLSKGFERKRHIIAAFGFDEESSGIISASRIGEYLEETYGKDSFYAVIDEGRGLGIDALTGTIFAKPSTGEKGYLDIQVELTTPGGHSSIPPDHTSIGIISELNYVIEKDPYRPILTEKNPILQYSQCAALHDPENNIPTFLKKSFLRAGHDRIANAILVGKILENKLTKYLIKTSQAIDIISGGEKANALPEDTKVLINHRIAVESSVDEVKAHFVTRVVEVAKRHNLSVVAYGDEVLTDAKDSGLFNVTVNSKPLNAAPVTPTNDTVWAYLSGVTRHVFEDLVFTNITYPIVTVPSILTGNTDTRHYWNLTRNIFRFTPQFSNNFPSGVHSVDEKLPFSAHLQLQAWFYEYLQAIDTKDANN
ncbi:Carboxypeptidase S [Candida viswanathii]|uniref:Carboxypeptidase S n=1 Tax=Candida viswanathii TaxID=5486 RepID=A0A367Y972_9ASCO|nr:Carboxypeptidase S [Candida viswanathii]